MRKIKNRPGSLPQGISRVYLTGHQKDSAKNNKIKSFAKGSLSREVTLDLLLHNF